MSVHVHFFDITEGDPEAVVREAVPVLTVWVPRRLEADWLAQEQGQSRQNAD